MKLISIPALREEGDFSGLMQVLDEHIFLYKEGGFSVCGLWAPV